MDAPTGNSLDKKRQMLYGELYMPVPIHAKERRGQQFAVFSSRKLRRAVSPDGAASLFLSPLPVEERLQLVLV